jgi:hypothetical protein
MRRRSLALSTVLALALGAGGCAYGTPARLTAAQQDARVRFVEAHGNLTDRQLARLCPGLYPRDFLRNTKKYPLVKQDKAAKQPRIAARDRAQAKAAGCDVRP